MHDFSQWLQSAGGTDWTPILIPILITGILLSLAIGVMCESVTVPIVAVSLCLFAAAGLPQTLKSEITQVWGLESVSSECDLPDRELPTRNMRCYVTDKDKRKRLVEIRVSKDGTKLGLYDTDGKALKTTGKE